MDDRRDGVEKGQRGFVGQCADRGGERSRGKRACGDDDVAPIRRRQAIDFGAADLDQRMIDKRLGHRSRKAIAIHCKRTAGGHLVGVSAAHDQRSQPAHLGVQQSDCIVGGVVGAERVRADEFGETVGLVRLGHPVWAHLMQHHPNALSRNLPSGLRAGEAGADDMDGGAGTFDLCHGRRGSAFSGQGESRFAAAIVG